MSQRRLLQETLRRFRRRCMFAICLTLIAGPVNACGDQSADACFERALALRKAGQASAALPLLRSVLAARPGMLRVKAELASTLLAVDDFAAARTLVGEVLAVRDLPVAVRRNLNRLLTQIKAREHALRQPRVPAQTLSFGLGYDDRLDLASGDISTSSISPVLSGPRDERGAAYTKAGWIGRWRAQREPATGWQLALAATARRHLGDDASDLDALELSPGQQWRVGRDAVLDIALLTHRLNRGGKSFLRETGATTRLAKPAQRNGEEWLLGVNWSARRYTQFEQQLFAGDSWRLWGAYGSAMSQSPHWRWSVQAEVGAWDSPLATLDYRSLRLSTALIFAHGPHRAIFGLEQQHLDFEESLIGFAQAPLSNYSRLEEPPIKLFARNERHRQLRLSYRYRLSPTWRVQLGWLYTPSEADVFGQNFRRNAVDLTFVKRLP